MKWIDLFRRVFGGVVGGVFGGRRVKKGMESRG